MIKRDISIGTETIKLDSLLKWAALAQTGGEAKTAIAAGECLVNGEVCTMRGRKLRPGDKVTYRGEEITVTGSEA